MRPHLHLGTVVSEWLLRRKAVFVLGIVTGKLPSLQQVAFCLELGKQLLLNSVGHT